MAKAKTPAEWPEWYEKHGGHKDLELDEREADLEELEKSNKSGERGV